jgi:hypothetical protein
MIENDSSASAPGSLTDGKTAMQRYAEFHTRNCRCIPADAEHGDGAQDNTHTDAAAEARRENQENEK